MGDGLEFDVAVIGGGMAGALLARQLKRRAPELAVGLFERSTRTSYKVGEATVEITANYLIRRHGLSHYLYEQQLPKNGLRYFFDNAGRNAPLEQMSEVGTVNLPFHPAFQLDRASFERDLLEMNRRAGVRVYTGATVNHVALGEGGARHGFDVHFDGQTRRAEASWVVDAAGRVGMLARQLGLRDPEPTHHLGSVWGRFEGVFDIDKWGAESFRARVRHTPRRLSTIHFWYPGYWIWFIPLRGGVTSVGVTGEIVAERADLRTADGFREFLLSHRAVGDLLREAKGLDVGSYRKIAYGTRRFFHPDRWALIGEAAQAADPLYSPGGDFIALENDFLTDMIVRDRVEGDVAAMQERCALYEEFMQFRHEAAMRLYRDLYDCHGSFELARLKWDFDIGFYYNLWVSSYLCDQHFDPAYLRAQLRVKPFILQAMLNFSRLFQRVDSHLRANGDYFRSNLGEFYYGLENIDFAEDVGTERSEQAVTEKTLQLFNHVRASAHVLLGLAARTADVEVLPLTGFLGDRDLG
jgi:flavin-dependent dehydrogenase